jgi:hypothetical protein
VLHATAAHVGTAATGVSTGIIEAGHDVVAVAIKKRPLVVLSYWSFTPSKGKDFEEVVKAIPIRPNGGVLRFGKLPWQKAKIAGAKSGIQTLTADGYLSLDGPGPAQATYRGPLSPVPLSHSHKIALRAAPEELQGGQVADYSYAAAFELGRLLALADDSVLEDLQGVRSGPVFNFVAPDILAVTPIPAAIAKKDWGVNPPPTDIQNPTADPTGIAQLFTTQEKQQIISQLGGSPVAEPGGGILDIEDVTIAELEHMFPRVLTNGRS